MTRYSSPFRTALILACLMASTACTSLTRSDYAVPDLPVAPTWQSPVDSGIAYDGPWWQAFGDQDLNSLVDQVLSVNGNLAAAGIRLRQARLSARLAATQLRPSPSGSLSTGASRPLEGGGTWNENASTSLGASWEVDLFGKLDATRDAARWEAQASEYDLAATRLSLIGTTVNGWWQLGYANERIALAESSLAYSRQALALVEVQYRAGAVSRLDLRDAQQSVAAQEASLTQLVQARTEARNVLAALLQQQIFAGPEPETLPVIALPAIDAGLPADLLARRPDLAAAELRLRQSLATADATRASFYPSLSLTGALGTASTSLLSFLSNPVASLASSLSLPFLDVEKVRLNTGIARADYEIAVEQFRQNFYDALRDTASTLSARGQYQAQAEALLRNYEAARDSEQLYERRYRAGAIAVRLWLDAQERRRTAESSLIANRYDQLGSQVSVYLALGGSGEAVP